MASPLRVLDVDRVVLVEVALAETDRADHVVQVREAQEREHEHGRTHEAEGFLMLRFHLVEGAGQHREAHDDEQEIEEHFEALKDEIGKQVQRLPMPEAVEEHDEDAHDHEPVDHGAGNWASASALGDR